MSSDLESLISHIYNATQIKDVSAALLKFCKEDTPFALSLDTDVIPALIYRTHVTTISGGASKSILLSDFKNILENLMEKEEKHLPPLNLPFGCFMFNRQGNTMELNCYHAERIEKIKYINRDNKTSTFKIPLPNIITSFILKKVEDNTWQLTSAKYFSTPKPVTQLPDNSFIRSLNLESGIHRLPFPNMYGDCRMCFGGNTMPVRFLSNLRGLDYYYQILTQAPFNDDLGILGTTVRTNVVNWFESLENLKAFPYELLSKHAD
jgi:hypothetical protein